MNEAPSAVVVGGGIVGICCALYLQREGLCVTLIDPAEAGNSTAKWSCGQFAVSEIIPLSKPGVIRKVPGWLLDRHGPLTLRPGAIPELLPWMMRFLANATPSRIERIATELTSLTRHVYDDYRVLINACRTSPLVGSVPTLEVFDDEAGLKHERRYIELKEKLGYKVSVVGREEISRLEPAVAGRFSHGLVLEDWRSVLDTEGFMVALNQSFIEQGGTRIRGRVERVIGNGARAESVRLDDGQVIALDQLVVAAGTGSRSLLPSLGLSAPLLGIGGYQVVLPTPGVEFKRATVYADGGFGFIPMQRGLQIGGTIEFAGRNATPNMDRARVILDRARAILPQLDTRNAQFGCGFRPSMPDTKPVIDRSPRFRNVVGAFGHGQLGLTLGATTGRLVADLIHEREDRELLKPFSASRF